MRQELSQYKWRAMIRYVVLSLLVAKVGAAFKLPDIYSGAVRKAQHLAPELFLNATERTARAGYRLETHYVTTEDGYILGQHRIPGSQGSPPILIQHGLGSKSDCWISSTKNRSLVFHLADLGYDVWMGNCRGNVYSRNHTSLDPSNRKFWMFSWHEMGFYDLPATIDYILNTTGQSQLFYIGHSMGVTMSYVMLSKRPEYNQKMRLVVSMAPAIFVTAKHSRLLEIGLKSIFLYKIRTALMGYELLPYSEKTVASAYYQCRDGSWIQKICRNIIADITGETNGYRTAELPTMVVLAHGGRSAFTVLHYIQLMKSGRFQEWNHGSKKNLRVYGSRQPPEYNLTKITAPVSIHYGDTDHLVPAAEALRVSKLLPNVVEVRRVPSSVFSHVDFLAHMNLKDLLIEHLLNILKKY